MSEWDSSGYDSAESYDSGPVQFEFVDAPALNGEHVEWSFRTVGHKTAPAGTVTSEIAVMTHDHNLIGGGQNTLHSELGPHDIGGGRINPVQYTHDDGDYYLSITVGGDVKYVSYRVHDHRAQAV
jgi:hypothetical protein